MSFFFKTLFGAGDNEANQQKAKQQKQQLPSTTSKPKWHRLADNPIHVFNSPCPVLLSSITTTTTDPSQSQSQTNQMKIMCVGDYQEPFTTMYDIESNTFPKEFINERHLQNTKLYGPTMAFNSRDNEVVVYGGQYHRCFLTYNVRSGEWKQIVDQSTSEQQRRDYQIEWVGLCPRMVFDANHALHVVGGSLCNTHSIWDAKKKKFKKIFQFPFRCITAHGLIYNERKDALLLIGGDNGNDMIHFFICFHPHTLSQPTKQTKIKPLIDLLISGSVRMCVGMVVISTKCNGESARS